MQAIDLERFQNTPLTSQPFPYLIVPDFIKPPRREAIHAHYPQIDYPGSFPVEVLAFGPSFKSLLQELEGDEMRHAFASKFGIDLTDRPTMITARGRCSAKDGRIHTDAPTKIITVLIYMNREWDEPGGRLRLLNSPEDLDDMILEVPPSDGTLLAFQRSDNSWHGHKPFKGRRRVIQLNWVTSQRVRKREIFRHRFSAWTKKAWQAAARLPAYAGAR